MKPLRPLSAYKQEKNFSAIVDKGRAPDPGRIFDPVFLIDRLVEESDDELRDALFNATSPNKEVEDLHEAYTEVLRELADVANFVDYLDESIRETYRQHLEGKQK